MMIVRHLEAEVSATRVRGRTADGAHEGRRAAATEGRTLVEEYLQDLAHLLLGEAYR